MRAVGVAAQGPRFLCDLAGLDLPETKNGSVADRRESTAIRREAERSDAAPGDRAKPGTLAPRIEIPEPDSAIDDATIAVFDTKYHYNFWRPITAIQEGDGDGNPRTAGETNWTPFLATAYPDYTSGANNFASSFTTILQLFFDTDEIDFIVPGPNASVAPRAYHRFSTVQEEVVEVRIYQGIHFRFPDEEGRRQGARIAHWVFQKYLKPAHGKK